MSFNDTLIKRVESAYTDEFEVRVYEQSLVLACTYITYLSFALGAALSWLIPGKLSIFSFLALAPVIIGSLPASNWFRKRVPQPVLKSRSNISAGEWIYLIAVVAVWLVGMWVSIGRDFDTGIGMIVGGIVGGVAAFCALPIYSKYLRKRDEKRLDAELADD